MGRIPTRGIDRSTYVVVKLKHVGTQLVGCFVLLGLILSGSPARALNVHGLNADCDLPPA